MRERHKEGESYTTKFAENDISLIADINAVIAF